MVDTRPVTCSGCGAERSPKVASTIPRPPCPECGETAVKWEVTSASAMTMSSSVMASLAPGEQERDWERRWQDAQQHLARPHAPRTEPLSSFFIHAAHADLQAFYIQTYHLKDSLKKASSEIGSAPKRSKTQSRTIRTLRFSPISPTWTSMANFRNHRGVATSLRLSALPGLPATTELREAGDSTLLLSIEGVSLMASTSQSGHYPLGNEL